MLARGRDEKVLLKVHVVLSSITTLAVVCFLGLPPHPVSRVER